MKPKTIIISILIVLFAFCAMGQSGCFDVSNPPTPTSSMPTGEFQTEAWLDLTSTSTFGENPTMEEREDGMYIVFPAGIVPEGTMVLTFAAGGVLKTHVVTRWEDGGLVRRIVETDPETGAPKVAIGTGSFAWEMYTDTGQLIFVGIGTIVERRFVFNQEGQVIEGKDIQPSLLVATGVGPYKGYVLTNDIMSVQEVRDGVPGLAFSGPGTITKR